MIKIYDFYINILIIIKIIIKNKLKFTRIKKKLIINIIIIIIIKIIILIKIIDFYYYSHLTILIKNIDLFIENFLFELIKNCFIALFVIMINFSFHVVLTRNDFD